MRRVDPLFPFPAMALVISVGITSALGYPYTPMHAALPFIALGKSNV
jgi:hypothetical protein